MREALKKGRPDIFNTDQGTQFTNEVFTGLSQQHGVRIGEDLKGSYNDNPFIERLCRSVKHEEVYLKGYQDGREARIGLGNYFRFYNTKRPHQALGYRTPAEEFTSTSVETTGTGMVKSLILDLLRIAAMKQRFDSLRETTSLSLDLLRIVSEGSRCFGERSPVPTVLQGTMTGLSLSLHHQRMEPK